MNIENIFDDIKFKVSPKDDYRSSYRFRFIKSFYKIFKKEKNYVFDNCIINKEKIDLDLRKELIKIDSMSTYAIGYLINRICKNLSKNQVYLNIGCWKGFSLVAGMINTECKVIGVDNFSQFTGPKNDFLKNFENSKKNNHFFFEQDYEKYFESLNHTKDKFDFYFYDGEHSYDNQFKNLEVADKFLNIGSIILIDDINFDDVYQGTLDFINKTKSKFKIIKEIKTANNHCHPSFWNGIMILKKV